MVTDTCTTCTREQVNTYNIYIWYPWLLLPESLSPPIFVIIGAHTISKSCDGFL